MAGIVDDGDLEEAKGATIEQVSLTSSFTPPAGVTDNGLPIEFTPPTGAGKLFIRMQVIVSQASSPTPPTGWSNRP